MSADKPISIPKQSTDLADIINRSITETIEKIVAEETEIAAQEAAKRVKSRVSGQLLQITGEILSYFDMKTLDNRLIITINNGLKEASNG